MSEITQFIDIIHRFLYDPLADLIIGITAPIAYDAIKDRINKSSPPEHTRKKNLGNIQETYKNTPLLKKPFGVPDFSSTSSVLSGISTIY